MLINKSGNWLYLDKDNNVLVGDVNAPADAVTVLCAPGGSLDESVASAYGATDHLTPHHEAGLLNPVTGEPVVLKDGRAYAEKLAKPVVVKVADTTGDIKHIDHPKADRAAVEVDEVHGVHDADAVASKDIKGPAERKDVGGPKVAPAVAKVEPAKVEPAK